MGKLNLFFTLAVIDFESDNIDYDDLYLIYKRTKSNDYEMTLFHHDKNAVYGHSRLYKLWRMIWRISPNYYFLDWLLSKIAGDSIDIGNLTIFGYNAMMWCWRLRTSKGYWSFTPPCFLILGGRGFTMGHLYFSPDGTLCHPRAKKIYGVDSEDL